jgi:hypothetical protein
MKSFLFALAVASFAMPLPGYADAERDIGAHTQQVFAQSGANSSDSFSYSAQWDADGVLSRVLIVGSSWSDPRRIEARVSSVAAGSDGEILLQMAENEPLLWMSLTSKKVLTGRGTTDELQIRWKAHANAASEVSHQTWYYDRSFLPTLTSYADFVKDAPASGASSSARFKCQLWRKLRPVPGWPNTGGFDLISTRDSSLDQGAGVSRLKFKLCSRGLHTYQVEMADGNWQSNPLESLQYSARVSNLDSSAPPIFDVQKKATLKERRFFMYLPVEEFCSQGEAMRLDCKIERRALAF